MKIGFFGGAFDPIHNEHRSVILHAKEELALDAVIVYPSAFPPHKSCVAPFEERKKMAVAALKDLPYVIVDDVENTLTGTNPTVKVLPVLLDKYKPEESYFIIGGDSIAKFSKWIQPEKIARLTRIAVVARGERARTIEDAERVEKTYGAKVTVLQYVGKQVSSSLVKAKIETGETPDGVCEEVMRIIREDGLYGERRELVDTLRSNMTSARFEHVKRTTYYAMKLNEKLGLPYEKVFTAGILHDCAKHLKREIEGVPPAVVHQFTGAEEARTTYGVTDEEVLSAIRYHTTGRPDMTTLEKLIFTADVLEEGRDYPGVEELRKIAEEDFERGFVACVRSGLNKLYEDKKPIHPLTEECALYYNIKN